MKKPEPIKKHIYVELDALFDTRLILAWIMDPESVIPYVESGKYFNRIKDNYGNISADIFNTIFKERNKMLLLQAPPTKLINYIRDHFGELMLDVTDVEISNKKQDNTIRIYVNIYPYDLTEEEQTNIIEYVKISIPKCEVIIINRSPYEVTPKWIKKHVSNIYMYNLLPWIEYHTSTMGIFTYNMLDCVCVGAALVNYNIREVDVDKEYFMNIMDGLKLFTNVYLIPANIFSADFGIEEEDTKTT